jgi:ribonuclease-3
MLRLGALLGVISSLFRKSRGFLRAEGSGRPTLRELVKALPPDLYRHALTHSSWVGARTGSYERLEFLGDSVLGLAIASALYERFPEEEEGRLARVKAFVVSRASCIEVARGLGVADLILADAPAPLARRQEAAATPSVQGNVLEALIGASYLVHGFAATREAVIDAFREQIARAASSCVDAKTALQEWLATRGSQPQYRLVETEGPAHARTFTSEVLVDGAVRGRGTGTTIKMSEQAAAQQALESLGVGSEGR